MRQRSGGFGRDLLSEDSLWRMGAKGEPERVGCSWVAALSLGHQVIGAE